MQFVERGHFVRDDFAVLKKSFVDQYKGEEYDLSEVLAKSREYALQVKEKLEADLNPATSKLVRT